jgi:DNA-binding CsgD family transcriptional regulator
VTLRSWLVGGRHNVTIHPRRRAGGNRQTREVLAADPGWVRGDQSGWRGLVSALQRHTVLSALSELRAGDREILTMAYLEGHTNTEIAILLHVSVRTVSRRLSAALARLEQHARNVGIWLAAFGVAVLTATQRRLNALTRSDALQAASLSTFGVVTAATITFAGVEASSPAVSSLSSHQARSTSAVAQLAGHSVVTVTRVTAVNPAVPLNAAKLKREKSSTRSAGSYGCHGKPVSAALRVQLRAHGAGSPVSHPGRGGCGPHAP